LGGESWPAKREREREKKKKTLGVAGREKGSDILFILSS